MGGTEGGRVRGHVVVCGQRVLVVGHHLFDVIQTRNHHLAALQSANTHADRCSSDHRTNMVGEAFIKVHECEREREGGRERDRETDRDRERETEIKRERERERDTHTQRGERDRDQQTE